MAYRRSITARTKLFYEQQHRVAPSFSHIHRDNSDREQIQPNPVSRNAGFANFLQHRCYGNGNSFKSLYGSRVLFQDRRFGAPMGCAPMFARNFSSGSFGEGVAAAADSLLRVAALEYLIDYVHSTVPLDWWAAIAVTSIMIHTLQIPLLMNHLKSTTKFTDLRSSAVAEFQARMKELFKEIMIQKWLKKCEMDCEEGRAKLNKARQTSNSSKSINFERISGFFHAEFGKIFNIEVKISRVSFVTS